MALLLTGCAAAKPQLGVQVLARLPTHPSSLTLPFAAPHSPPGEMLCKGSGRICTQPAEVLGSRALVVNMAPVTSVKPEFFGRYPKEHSGLHLPWQSTAGTLRRGIGGDIITPPTVPPRRWSLCGHCHQAHILCVEMVSSGLWASFQRAGASFHPQRV